MSTPEEILSAVDRGWSLVRLNRKKEPIGKWKELQITPATLEQVRKWGTPPMWGVITGAISGFWALDFDPEAMELFELLGIPANARTPRGGAHLYFEHPGVKVPTLNGKSAPELGRIWPGLDVRGDGGLVGFHGANGNGPYRLLRPEPHPIKALPFELRQDLARVLPCPALLGTTPPTPEGLVEWALKRTARDAARASASSSHSSSVTTVTTSRSPRGSCASTRQRSRSVITSMRRARRSAHCARRTRSPRESRGAMRAMARRTSRRSP